MQRDSSDSAPLDIEFCNDLLDRCLANFNINDAIDPGDFRQDGRDRRDSLVEFIFTDIVRAGQKLCLWNNRCRGLCRGPGTSPGLSPDSGTGIFTGIERDRDAAQAAG